MVRKAYIFSFDALIAATLIFFIIIIIPFFYFSKQPDVQPVYYASDLAEILSIMKLSEITDPDIINFLNNNNVTNFNVTFLEQILRFQVANKENEATELASKILTGLIPYQYGMSLNMYDYPDSIYLKNKSSVKQLITSRRMISGMERNQTIEGLSSKVFLTGINSKVSASYLYFGGYVGNGNITKQFYLPNMVDINGVYMELDVGGDFDLYINGVYSGNYTNTSGYDLIADKWYINESYFSNFKSGMNNISIEFTGYGLDYIGGGFIRINYDTPDIDTTAIQYSNGYATKKDWLSGIDGIINLYSSLYIPGILQDLTIYLHYFANHTQTKNSSLLLIIYNTTVYNDKVSTTEQKITLNDTNLSPILDYAEISEKTIPLRLGFENVTFLQYFVEGRGTGDAVLITDVSGSMGWYMQDDSTNGIYRICYDPNLVLGNTQRLSVAKCVDKTFVDNILDVQGDRIGLVSYQSTLDESMSLSDNSTELKGHIETYFAGGSTCISCGVYEATQVLLANPKMPLHDDTWLYTTKYQYISPPSGWYNTTFNDSSWSGGSTVFGFLGVTTDIGNKFYVDLWEMTNDTPQPVDFTTGLNSTNNTFSINGATRYVLTNSQFTGPSITNWTQKGIVNLSLKTNIFFDDFEDYYTSTTQINGNDINRAPGYWYIDDTGEEIYIRVNDGSYPAYSGTDVLVFRDMDSYGYAETTIDLSPYSAVNLSFVRRLGPGSFDSGEYADVQLSNNSGSSWTTIATYISGDDDDNYHQENFELGQGNLTSGFMLRFGARSSSDTERFYVEDVRLNTSFYNFGLSDYWYVDSKQTSFGSLQQNFSSPYSNPEQALLYITHSTNDAYFDGTADVFCNLTYSGGIIQVWYESWTSANNPIGQVDETIDITNYITSDSYNYILECGCIISGVNTLVAFDNISIEIRGNSNDGWDWGRGNDAYGSNLDDGASGDFNMTTLRDPYGISWGTTHYGLKRLEIEIGGAQCGDDCGYMDSGAFGVQVNITQELYDTIVAGGSAIISFDYEAYDREGVLGGIDDTEGSVWIKARFSNQTHSYYLGYDLDSSGSGQSPGDSTKEILWDHSSQDNRKWEQDDLYGDFNMDSDGHYNKGTFTQNISQYINAPGWYYIDFGAKFDASYSWQGTSEGIVAFFDNIKFIIYNQSGNYYFRKHFTVDDINTISDPELYVYSDDGADIYLNNELISSDSGPHDAYYWNVNGLSIGVGNLTQGENVLAVKLYNDDSDSAKFDLELRANVSNRKKAMVIMSDGEANYCHGPDDGVMDQNGWSGSCYDWQAKNETIEFACYAKQNYNISIYTVAFGNSADNDTLNRTACCDDCSQFYKSSNVTELYEIYNAIAEDIKESSATRIAQTINTTGSAFKSFLYPDSYIEYTYIPTTPTPQIGYIPITMESERFNNNISEGSFDIPLTVTVSDAKVTSYSGDRWTDLLQLRNSSGGNYSVIYNLSTLRSNYENLGDPYIVQIPANKIGIGQDNSVIISTAYNASNSSGGSPDNKIIYTININTYVNYSGVFDKAEGCNWSVEYQDGTNDTLLIPSYYSGSQNCVYNASTDCSQDYNDDAIDSAVCLLFEKLDVDNDGKLYVNIGTGNLETDILSVGKIPFMWGPTIMEVRVW